MARLGRWLGFGGLRLPPGVLGRKVGRGVQWSGAWGGKPRPKAGSKHSGQGSMDSWYFTWCGIAGYVSWAAFGSRSADIVDELTDEERQQGGHQIGEQAHSKSFVDASLDEDEESPGTTSTPAPIIWLCAMYCIFRH
jgi:hypothetical protein